MNSLHSDRSKYIDIAKALGIICVVIGHSGSPLKPFIYLFHMPLFFFISGYLYNNKYTSEPISLIKKRTKTLYVPFVKYGLLFLIMHNALARLHIYNDNYLYNPEQYLRELLNIFTFGGTEKLLGIFWFITALYLVNVSYCTIRYIALYLFKMRNELIFFVVILLIFLIGNLLSLYSIKLPRGADIALVALIFFHGGYLYKQYGDKIPLSGPISICCALLLVTSAFYGSINLIGRSYVNPGFLLLNSGAGIYLTFYISKNLIQFQFLDYVGRNTLAILALHFLSFKLITLIEVLLYDYPISMMGEHPVIHNNSSTWWVAYSVAGLAIPLFISFLGTKISSSIRTRLSLEGESLATKL